MEPSTEPIGHLRAFGNQLIEVHIWLREELARLRTHLDSYFDGGGERPRELRTHCLTFCSALSRHHAGENGGAFPVLAQHVPDLRPVLDELEHDHHVVTGILRSVEELVGGLGTRADPAEAQRMRAELDGLAAVLETHFVYEERRLVSALNSLRVPDWNRLRPDFLLTGAGAASEQAE
jgi:hypothetical protein